MDIYCRHCGEPWDVYELHDILDANGDRRPYSEASKLFKAYGCGAFDPTPQICEAAGILDETALDAIGALTDLMGDDIDGLASLSEDVMGMFR